MTPSIATFVGIGTFWILFLAARQFPRLAITVAIVLDVIVLLGLAAFAIYGFAVPYPTDTRATWPEWHMLDWLFVGPLLTLVSTVFLVRHLLRKYPISGVIK